MPHTSGPNLTSSGVRQASRRSFSMAACFKPMPMNTTSESLSPHSESHVSRSFCNCASASSSRASSCSGPHVQAHVCVGCRENCRPA